jgi:hypothetical protein
VRFAVWLAQSLRYDGGVRAAVGILVIAACGFHHGAAPGDGAITDGGKDGSAANDASDARADAPRDAVANANGYDKPITVQRAKVAGDVTGFPVWITLSNDADLIAHARADHSDVYFTDMNGAAIAYEITHWDRATGTLQAWVRAAHLTPSTLTPDPNELHLRFGGPDAPIGSSGAVVFDNSFSAVWHLEDTTVADATGTAPGTIAGTAVAATGELGGGLAFTGASTAVTFTNPITGNTSSTLSAWVYETMPTATEFSYALIVLGTAAADQARWFYAQHGSHGNSMCAGLYADDEVPTTAVVVPKATWNKLDWTYDSATKASRLYINGAQVDTATLGTAATAGTAGMFGNAPSAYGAYGPTNFVGTLDEVRIAATARSANWLLTEYRNQSDPTRFYMVGSATAL